MNAMEIIGPYNSATMEDVDDMASHIIIFPYDSKKEKYIQGFNRQRFEAGYAGLFGEGQYDSEDIKRHHLDKGGYDGSLNSLVVPEGLIATLYKEDFYRGERLVIQGPKAMDFSHSEVQNWNHEMRSLQVVKVEHAKIDVLTKWERVASGNVKHGTISHVIQQGWSKDVVQKDEKTVLEEFTATAEAGFSFMGAYAKTTLTNHVSLNIFSSCERSIHSSKLITDTAVCENPERQLVALYQWTLQTLTGTQEGENDIYIQDTNYICRYGLNSNSAPVCPLTMCADPELIIIIICQIINYSLF